MESISGYESPPGLCLPVGENLSDLCIKLYMKSLHSSARVPGIAQETVPGNQKGARILRQTFKFSSKNAVLVGDI